MFSDTTTERGHESALSACPQTAAATSSYLLVGARLTAPAGAGLGAQPRLGGGALRPIAFAGPRVTIDPRLVNVIGKRSGGDMHSEQFFQFVPTDPGALTRRPPA